MPHLQAEVGLSHMWPVRGSNLHQSQRRDDQMIKSAEIQRPYPIGHGGRLIILLLTPVAFDAILSPDSVIS